MDPKGGFNERFGRVFELDRLARQFTTNVGERAACEVEKRGPTRSICPRDGEASPSLPRDSEVLQGDEGDAERRLRSGDARAEGRSRPDEPDLVRRPEVSAAASAREHYSSV